MVWCRVEKGLKEKEVADLKYLPQLMESVGRLLIEKRKRLQEKRGKKAADEMKVADELLDKNAMGQHTDEMRKEMRLSKDAKLPFAEFERALRVRVLQNMMSDLLK